MGKKKLFDSRWVSNPVILVEIYLSDIDILTSPYEYIFSLINSVTNDEDQCRFTVLTQDTSTISINQLPTSHAFRKSHIMLGSKVSMICHLFSVL
jgi:hypothetical protein